MCFVVIKFNSRIIYYFEIWSIWTITSTIDNVNNKIAKLDKAVSIVDGAADYISIVSDKVVGIISTLITSVLKRKKRKKKGDNENE